MKIKELAQVTHLKIAVDASEIDNIIIDANNLNIMDMEIKHISIGHFEGFDVGFIVYPDLKEGD